MARERTDMTPSLLGSVLLHGGLVLAALISWHFGKDVHIQAAVPVTIVANAPVTNIRPAVEAPVQTPPRTETPEPDATPEPPAPPTPEPPAPQPKPTPPKPAPQKPAPSPAKTPAPKKAEPKPTPKQPTLNLDELADSLKPSRSAAKPKSSAAKGKNRYETAIKARTAQGEASGLAAVALNTLSADLARRWNPNCEVEGGSDVNIDVTFRLDGAGRVVGTVEAKGENSSNPVVRVAADRAKRAVHEAEPFDNLPSELYGERITVRFNARTACASG
ncbi:MAG TPA: energy transducer TonB [Caulobacteraceae bacterium]